MLSKKIILVLLTFLLGGMSLAQNCGVKGQRPAGAVPVCGNVTYHEARPPRCSTHQMYFPGCSERDPTAYVDLNPYWYKFTCYQSGSLGFVIIPNDPDNDYDWLLYDITGHDVNDVYFDQSIIMTGNWSGTYGPTGTSATPNAPRFQCASIPADNKGTFCAMPTLVAGNNYLLLLSHAVGQGGYSIAFGGGTANIANPTQPHLATTQAFCGGKTTIVKLSSKVSYKTLSGDGTEFTITPALATVLAADAFSHWTSFETDSITLTLSNPLPPGNYTVTIQNGSDGNTLVDFCDNAIPVGENIPLIIDPVLPIPMDSIIKPPCAPDELLLVFRRNIMCRSIAADGSDFVITGTTPITISAASGICDWLELAYVVKIKLSAPILTKGNYQIQLVSGTDGNTLVDECGLSIPAGGTLDFATKEAVHADFTYVIRLGCKGDTIDYFHPGGNEVNQWRWNFYDQQKISSLQNPSVVYNTFGQKHTQLIVSNGGCSDTSDVTILLDNGLNAAFEATALVCPNEPAVFKDNSTGNITMWNWNFGNGLTSNLPSPPPQFYIPPRFTTDVYPTLVIQNNYGCFDTAIQKIIVPNSCYIGVPNAFTPNNDGLNDYLYPLNAYKAKDLLFRVYSRFGQLVFEAKDGSKKWDGKFKGQPADPGTYIWILQYTNIETGKKVEQKGTSILLH